MQIFIKNKINLIFDFLNLKFMNFIKVGVIKEQNILYFYLKIKY